jgi:hypothetical protein
MSQNFAKLSKGIRARKFIKSHRISRRFNESPDRFKTIDVNNWRELTPFCPFCKGENVKSALEECPEWRGEEWFC